MTYVAKGYTDTIYQSVKLYIEGVQVPWTNISISSGDGGLPGANIVIPAQAGLMDIARDYSPKVHIFFSDRLGTYSTSSPTQMMDQDKLLFSGFITRVSYNKDKNYPGSVTISFTCVHRYAVMSDIIIDYSGWQTHPGDLSGNVNQNGATVKMTVPNSKYTAMVANGGIIQVQNSSASVANQAVSEANPQGSPYTLPQQYATFFNRIIGMPGVIWNYWNQMNKSAYIVANNNPGVNYSEPFTRLYKPLVEDGLLFFNRLGGHYPVEALTQNASYRVDPCPDQPGSGVQPVLVPPCYQIYIKTAVIESMKLNNVNPLAATGETTSFYELFLGYYSSIDYEVLTLTSPAEVPIYSGDLSAYVGPSTAASQTNATQSSAVTNGTNVMSTQSGSTITNPTTPPGPNAPGITTQALDTIVKPKIPFYFSPTCNVLFPGMYTTISLLYDEINVPTRISVKTNIPSGTDDNGTPLEYRAPASIRQAIAMKRAGAVGSSTTSSTSSTSSTSNTSNTKAQSDAHWSLNGTAGDTDGAIGLYEQGRGIKRQIFNMPQWMAFLSATETDTTTGTPPTQQSTDPGLVNAQFLLSQGWQTRYPGAQAQLLNPYSTNSDATPWSRMLFSQADYYYTEAFTATKAGRVDGPFNPYIVPGYPMDILDSNPTYPSFHAMCMRVTHNLSAQSCSTSIDFGAAMTYSELANYYIPFVSPMLEVALGLAENPTLVGASATALNTANEFYRYVLGTPAAAPDSLMNFQTMTINPFTWDGAKANWIAGSTASIPAPNGGELNPMLSFEGNLSLVQRPIESKLSITSRFNVKFIDMTMGNYGSRAMKYTPSNLTSATKFEIGQSQFLTYNTYFGQALYTQDLNVGTSSLSPASALGVVSP